MFGVRNYELLENKSCEGCIILLNIDFIIAVILWLIFMHYQLILPVFLECFCQA